MNRENLLKLATYLDTLPADYAAFEMQDYFIIGDSDEDKKIEVEYALHNGGVHNCGAVACAVGHGPSAGLLVPKDLINPAEWATGVNWTGYVDRFFLPGFSTCPSEDPIQFQWEWMFSSLWSNVDNTPAGAASRIRWLLIHETPPFPFDDYEERTDCTPRAEYVELYRGF